MEKGKSVRNELVQLAQERSSDKRRALLRELSQHFLSDEDAITDRASALFGTVVERLLDDMDIETRADYAEDTASSHFMPKSVALRLANDDIKVAAPFLEKSPVLDDDDLVSIARSQSQSHLFAVASRESLSESVTDVLVERGESPVLKRVSINPGARISEHSYETLASKAIGDAELGEALSSRTDLPITVAEKLMHCVAPHARATLESYLKQNGVDAAVELAEKAQEEYETARKKDRQHRIEGKVLLQDVLDNKRSINDVMIMLCGQNRLFDVALILSRLSGLDESALIRVLCATADDPIAVACKASGLNEAAIEAVGTMRCRRLRRPARTAQKLVHLAHELNEADAERVIRFARLRSSLAAESSEAQAAPQE